MGRTEFFPLICHKTPLHDFGSANFSPLQDDQDEDNTEKIPGSKFFEIRRHFCKTAVILLRTTVMV